MRFKQKIISIGLAVAAVLLLAVPHVTGAAEEQKTLNVLFVHDVHSHLNTFSTVDNGETVRRGGLARICTLAKEQYAENPDTLFVDAGDFSMGTVVQSVFVTEAAELRVLGALGVDATTFGNHEYDYGPDGLAASLLRAKESGEKIPAIVVSNIDMEATKAQAESAGRKELLAAFEAYGVREYIMLTKGDVNIALMGIFGNDAIGCAPFSELIFKDPVQGAKETVAKILEKEDADIIVCLSHSGTWGNEEKSEDEILAKNVPEIDVIVSGHTHTELSKPIVHGSTYIVSAGEYGRNLGSMSLTQNADGTWALTEYALLPITEEVPEDAAMDEKIDGYLSMIDVNYLSLFGYERMQVLAENTVDFSKATSLTAQHRESPLGNIMTDAYRYAVANLTDWDGIPVDVAVVPAGLVREAYGMGNITVEDVFNAFSLGVGPDGLAGYPLVSAYLTGAELKLVAEIDASISPLMTYARLASSGLCWIYNPNRMILNKSFDAHLVSMTGERTELESDKLYRIVADLYSLQLLGSVTDLSYGLLSIVPKHADGTPIANPEDAIIMTEGREFKAWEAMADYIASFEDTDGDGVPDVPVSYQEEQGRKVVENSKKLGDLLKQPNKFFFAIAAIVLILIAVLVLLAVLVVKLVCRIRRNKIMEKKERLKHKV